jgi:hypothetical protein
MKKLLCVLVALWCVGTIRAQSVVNGFGVGGWYSWDTRSSAGAQLFGSANSHPVWREGGTPSPEADAAIAAQIKFLGEGATIADAAGGTPDASPTGSLNGLGYVRLDGTNANTGKSDFSYLDTGGIASSNVLLGGGFSTTYRYYSDSNPTSRRIGLNIEFTGTDAKSYIFVFVEPDATFTANGWNTATATAASQFYLYGGDATTPTPKGTQTKTLAEWSADSTWGSLLFGDGTEIFRVGFNIGSYQRNALIYLDWVESSLLNNGNQIDFQAIPEPGVTALLAGCLALAVLAPLRRRRAG